MIHHRRMLRLTELTCQYQETIPLTIILKATIITFDIICILLLNAVFQISKNQFSCSLSFLLYLKCDIFNNLSCKNSQIDGINQ